jgi:hypothetical protein
MVAWHHVLWQEHVVEEVLHLVAERKQSSNRKGPGQYIAPKDMSLVTYFLKQTPPSIVPTTPQYSICSNFESMTN